MHKRSSAPSCSHDSPPLKTVFLAIQLPQGRGTRGGIKNANERVEQMMENCFIQLHLALRQLTLRKVPLLKCMAYYVSSHPVTTLFKHLFCKPPTASTSRDKIRWRMTSCSLHLKPTRYFFSCLYRRQNKQHVNKTEEACRHLSSFPPSLWTATVAYPHFFPSLTQTCYEGKLDKE